MRSKKVVALLLAAIVALGSLAGCANQNDQTTAAPDKETSTQKGEEVTTTEAPTEAELEEKTIQVLLAGPGKQKDSDKVWEAFNEMLQEYVPNTTVEFTIIPFGEYYEEFTRVLASEEKIDLAWVGWNTAIQDNINDGNLMPLDDLLEQYGQGIIETLGEEVLDFHRNVADDKIYYAISWQGLVGNKREFWFPTELVELAGDGWLEKTQTAVDKWWSEPDNAANFNAVFDQLEIYLAAAKDAGKLYSGIRPGYTFGSWNGMYGTSTMVSGKNKVGVKRTSENTFEVFDGVKSESARVYAQRMSEFYEKGYIRSDIASLDMSTLKFVEAGAYNENTVIMYTHNCLTELDRENKENAAGVELSFIEREKDAVLTKGNSTAMSIPYCADDPERAMMVLNALYTEPELYQLLIYGFEGEHYTKNSDGTITTSYGSQGTADADYGLIKWTIGTCMNSLVTQADAPGYYEGLKEAQETAYINPFINFSFDKSNVEDICAALDAVDTVYEKMVANCAAGAELEKALDDWIKEREAAGVDKLIEEYERQLNEFIKENNITSW